MLLAFQGGDIHAELIGSKVYLKARDLLAMLGLTNSKRGSSTGKIFDRIRRNTNVIFYNNIMGKPYLRTSLYITANDATTFLDNIHKCTRPQTIQLMMEVLKQFNRG